MISKKGLQVYKLTSFFAVAQFIDSLKTLKRETKIYFKLLNQKSYTFRGWQTDDIDTLCVKQGVLKASNATTPWGNRHGQIGLLER